jgi:tRNA threonylcarbamoyladenosine biosynthesis protein TsaB
MGLRILAFDTSANLTSVALCDGAQVLVEDENADSDRHAEILLPRVQRCLAQSGLRLEDIDLFAVGIGPGSFTGVRVGVATAKGFGLALKRPVCGVVSLAALAAGAAGHGEWLAPVLDAFKGEVFAALYRATERGLQCVLEPFHAAPAAALARIASAAEARAYSLLGGGLRRYAAELGPLPEGATSLDVAFDAPRARHVARLAALALANGEVPPLAELAPLYVRDSDAQLPKTPLRL